MHKSYSFAAMPPRKKAKPRVCQASSGSALLDLPLDLLLQIVSPLSAADYRGLAGSCHKLRDLVLSQAKKLTLSLEAGCSISQVDRLRAPFLAAVRRPHGRLCLSLRLHQV
jgi:hypothetical protein